MSYFNQTRKVHMISSPNIAAFKNFKLNTTQNVSQALLASRQWFVSFWLMLTSSFGLLCNTSHTTANTARLLMCFSPQKIK